MSAAQPPTHGVDAPDFSHVMTKRSPKVLLYVGGVALVALATLALLLYG
jgi:hypothetical protein